MKEGLEDYFKEGQTPEQMPDVAPTQETHAQEEQVQEQTQEQAIEPTQEQAHEEVAPQEEVTEIGGAPQHEPTLETVSEEPTYVAPTKDLPEGVNKLVDFMNETNGTLQDYLSLNRDFDTMDQSQVLREYYKQTKSHLDTDDIEYLVNKRLAIDEDSMDENAVRDMKISLKEDLSKAKAHLSSSKERYYEDLKANSRQPNIDPALVARQQEASAFFQAETDKVFEGFKGFDFNLGEGKPTVRYKVEDADKVKGTQSDIQNVIGGFLDESGKVKDPYAYHKALFAMQNADKMAQLFYEQGKADAVKAGSTDSKNIDYSTHHKAPVTNTKLTAGQSREINTEANSKSLGMNLKYWNK